MGPMLRKTAVPKDGLLDEAVRNSTGGCDAQFLTGIAMAASVRSAAQVNGPNPFEFDHLTNVRTNIAEAAKLISQIRNREKPMLPIDEVMAGDDEIKGVMIQLLGQGYGSLAAAEKAQTDAEGALFKVQTNALDSLN